jgi:hypothetical protein
MPEGIDEIAHAGLRESDNPTQRASSQTRTTILGRQFSLLDNKLSGGLLIASISEEISRLLRLSVSGVDLGLARTQMNGSGVKSTPRQVSNWRRVVLSAGIRSLVRKAKRADLSRPAEAPDPGRDHPGNNGRHHLGAVDEIISESAAGMIPER